MCGVARVFIWLIAHTWWFFRTVCDGVCLCPAGRIFCIFDWTFTSRLYSNRNKHLNLVVLVLLQCSRNTDASEHSHCPPSATHPPSRQQSLRYTAMNKNTYRETLWFHLNLNANAGGSWGKCVICVCVCVGGWLVGASHLCSGRATNIDHLVDRSCSYMTGWWTEHMFCMLNCIYTAWSVSYPALCSIYR